MRKKLNNLLSFTPAIGWGILICYFSLLPSRELPDFLVSAQDIVLHFGIYMVYGILFVFGANNFTIKKVAVPFLILVFIILFIQGLAIEFIQGGFIEGRHFQWTDVLFNTLGSLLLFPLNWLLKS